MPTVTSHPISSYWINSGKIDSWVSEIFMGRKESWNLAKGDIQARVSSHLSHTVPNSEETEEKSLILVN